MVYSHRAAKKEHNPKTSKIKNTEKRTTTAQKKSKRSSTQNKEVNKNTTQTKHIGAKERRQKKRSERERKESTRNKCQTNIPHHILPLFKILHNICTKTKKNKRKMQQKKLTVV